MRNKVYRNIKSGNLYIIVEEDITNCTNDRDGIKMVLYREFGTSHQTMLLRYFVREKQEFFDKFELFEGEE